MSCPSPGAPSPAHPKSGRAAVPRSIWLFVVLHLAALSAAVLAALAVMQLEPHELSPGGQHMRPIPLPTGAQQREPARI